MGSPAPSDAPTPKPAAQAPLPPAPSKTAAGSDPAMDINEPDAIGYTNVNYVEFRGVASAVSTDFETASSSISRISDLINWTVAHSRTIDPTLADQCCENLITLAHTITELGLLKGFVERDDVIGVRHSTIGNLVTGLVNTPGIAAFTAAPEEIQNAKAPKKGLKAPTGKSPKGKSKAKAPDAPRPPPPIPHTMCPICPLPSKLAAAREEVGIPSVWVPVTNKQKSGLPQEEVLVRMAKNFPTSTTIALQQATAAVTGRMKQQTASEAHRVKQRRSTTQGKSRKSISVYSVPPFPWKEDEIFGQINRHLGNTK